ncbi:farnesyl transferase beta subunit isoform X2 [Oratosquilla oratoria]|uniref:farnesyl transferase beta subunit isoform X2 n=1 Tax=Oratosquilla oratoria TaxID=337810 RepID=UPI003F766ADB
MADEIRCLKSNLQGERHVDCGVQTVSSDEQMKVEQSVSAMFNFFMSRRSMDEKAPTLTRDRHTGYLKRGLKNLPEAFSCLDASRPWLVYWGLHALELLDEKLEAEEQKDVANFLKICQNTVGGFGGGPGQYSHLAPTYAAVNAVAILGTKEAYDIIDRESLSKFLWSMRTKEGAFTMHENGEVDIRGVYCAISVARLTNIYTEDLFDGTAQWIVRCQTYEGGFSGAPGLEAHGGYTFCAFAALALLGKQCLCDTEALLRWAVNRQMRYEGGFQGRTNKLVDGCYSFWQGGLFPLLHSFLTQEEPANISGERWMFQQEALQEYLLLCCQHPRGGLIDKPGKHLLFDQIPRLLPHVLHIEWNVHSPALLFGSCTQEESCRQPLQ